MRVVLIAIGLLFVTPILWTVSVGAVREARRARRQDPRTGCQAWVAVPGLRGRLYRCCEPVYAGGTWCLRHELGRERDDDPASSDTVRIDEPQAVGRAIVRARIGIPLALLTVLAIGALAVWAVQGR